MRNRRILYTYGPVMNGVFHGGAPLSIPVINIPDDVEEITGPIVTVVPIGVNEFAIQIRDDVPEETDVTVTVNSTDFTQTKYEWESTPTNLVEPMIQEDFSSSTILNLLIGTWTTPTEVLTYSYEWFADSVLSGTDSTFNTALFPNAAIYCVVTASDGVNTVSATTGIVNSPSQATQPDTVSGLVQWYTPADASTVTETEGMVSSLLDKSSSNLALTQTTALNQPTLGTQIAGLSTLSFNGSQYLWHEGLTFDSSGTIFSVFRITSNASGDASVYSYDQSPNGNQDFQFDADHTSFRGAVDSTRHSKMANSTSDKEGMLIIHMMRYDAVAGTIEHSFNGVPTDSATDYLGYADTQDFALGTNRNLNAGAAMDFCEFIRFDNPISNADANTVGSYLTRWGASWTDLT